MKKELNEKILNVYKFVSEYIENYGYPPSVREICASLKIKSTASVYTYLNTLKEKGYLEKSPLKKRALTLTDKKNTFKNIPLLGTVRAGVPIFAVENLDGYMPLPPEFSHIDEYFALKVSGDSMIKADIHDKDIIIVKKQENAENGEIVVSLIEDSATVKRFYKRDNKIILHPENDEMQDMIFKNVVILGVVKGLIRKF
jgi:repressor LexA